MPVQVVEKTETFRLISDGAGRFAVVEVRCGCVYSLDARHSRQALDTEEGMLAVVDEDGWNDEEAARSCFERAVRTGDRLSRVIW